MPRQFPTLEDVSLPNVQGARPVASIDPSGWGRGAEALARAGQKLGGDVQQVAKDTAETQLYRERQAVENGKIGLATELINNRAQFEDSNDPQVKSQWDAANQASYQKYRAQIPAPAGTELADHFEAYGGELLANENLRSTKRQRAVDSDLAIADISNSLATVRKSVKFDPSETPDATINAAQDGIHTKIDNAVARNLITAEHGELLKQNSAKVIADQYVADMVENHPDEYKKLRGTWTPQAKTSKAYGGDISGPQLEPGAPQAPTDGLEAPPLDHDAHAEWRDGVNSQTARIAEIVNNGETPNGRSINMRSLGQISHDTNGSKSYGFMGLNSASGSAADFVREYGARFGLRARPGTAAFDAQWHAAAMDQTDAFRDAQLSYFQEHHVAPVASELTKLGIPAAVANDPRVVSYFADRHVQMDAIGLNSAATAAWREAGGDPAQFLRNMNRIDGTPENLQRNFGSAIASGVYGPEGHANRLAKRLSGALSAGDVSGRGAVPDDTGHPFFAMMDPVELLRFDTRANQIIQQRAADQAALNSQRSLQAAQRWEGVLGAVGEGLAEVPPRDAIANDPNLDEGHRNQLLAHRANLVKQMGREALQSQADASADAEAAYMRNIIETRSGRAELIPLDVIRNDPQLTEQHRNRILEARQIEERRLGSEASTAQADDIEHRLINAQAGLGPMPDRAEIENNEALGSHRNRLLAQYDKIIEGGNTFAQRQLEKIRQDPAAFAVQNSRVVAEAWGKLQDAMQPGQSAIDPAAAASDYAAKTRGVQQYFGLSPYEMKLVPKEYVQRFGKVLEAVASADDPNARVGLVGKLDAEAKVWGTHWPAVVREIAPSAQPIVRAIAAGADQAAMLRLLSIPKDENPAKILKEQSETKYGDVTRGLNDAFAPFRKSLVGRQMDQDYPGYYGLGEKLAALYVRDGDDAKTAATKAFNALVGNRFDFRDTFRVPKSAGVSADVVQAGSVAARGKLGELGAVPPIDDMPGRSEPATVDLALVGRDGKWVTAPDNSGLNLMYGDKALRGADGKPLLVTWDRLSEMAKNQPSAPVPFRGSSVSMGPAPSSADLAEARHSIDEEAARQEEQTRSIAGHLASRRAQFEATMTPGTPEHEAALAGVPARQRADALADLDRQEQIIKTRPLPPFESEGRRAERLKRRDAELARISAERAKLGVTPRGGEE